MLGIEPCLIIYSAAIGGMLGALIVAIGFRKSHKDTLDFFQSQYYEDFKNMRIKIEDLQAFIRQGKNFLSPNSGDYRGDNSRKHHKFKR